MKKSLSSYDVRVIVHTVGEKQGLSNEEIKVLANSLWKGAYPDKEEWKRCPKKPW